MILRKKATIQKEEKIKTKIKIKKCLHFSENMIYYLSRQRATEKQNKRPVGQAVKTTPSHGVNPGSIPGQVI